jgi:hypothetical protein
MWSRHFLVYGLLSSVAVAVLALASIWVAILALPDSFKALLLGVIYGVPGMIIYPTCWYRVIFRSRTYSLRRTWYLIGITYAVCCLTVIIFALLFVFVAGSFYAAPHDHIAPAQSPQLPWYVGLLWLVAVITEYVLTLGAALAIPFVMLAGTLAFLHRALLLAWNRAAAGQAVDAPQPT